MRFTPFARAASKTLYVPMMFVSRIAPHAPSPEMPPRWTMASAPRVILSMSFSFATSAFMNVSAAARFPTARMSDKRSWYLPAGSRRRCVPMSPAAPVMRTVFTSPRGLFRGIEVELDFRAHRIVAEDLPDPRAHLLAQCVLHALPVQFRHGAPQVRRGERHVVDDAGAGLRQPRGGHVRHRMAAGVEPDAGESERRAPPPLPPRTP